MSEVDPNRLDNKEKIELVRLLCKLTGRDMDNLGHYCTFELAEMDLGPENPGRLMQDWSRAGSWYYSDGSCYPNQAWATANNWEG